MQLESLQFLSKLRGLRSARMQAIEMPTVRYAHDAAGFETSGFETSELGTIEFEATAYNTIGYETNGYETNGYETMGLGALTVQDIVRLHTEMAAYEQLYQQR